MLKRALVAGGLGGVISSLVLIFPIQMYAMGRIAPLSFYWFIICTVATIIGLVIKDEKSFNYRR